MKTKTRIDDGGLVRHSLGEGGGPRPETAVQVVPGNCRTCNSLMVNAVKPSQSKSNHSANGATGKAPERSETNCRCRRREGLMDCQVALKNDEKSRVNSLNFAYVRINSAVGSDFFTRLEDGCIGKTSPHSARAQPDTRTNGGWGLVPPPHGGRMGFGRSIAVSSCTRLGEDFAICLPARRRKVNYLLRER